MNRMLPLLFAGIIMVSFIGQAHGLPLSDRQVKITSKGHTATTKKSSIRLKN